MLLHYGVVHTMNEVILGAAVKVVVRKRVMVGLKKSMSQRVSSRSVGVSLRRFIYCSMKEGPALLCTLVLSLAVE